MNAATDTRSPRRASRRSAAVVRRGVAVLGMGATAGLVLALSWPHAPWTMIADHPPAAEGRQMALRGEVVGLLRRLDAITRPCDAAVGAVSARLPPISNPRAPPETAGEAQARCAAASLELLDLQPPKAVPEARPAFQAALDQCRFVYAAEANAQGRLAAALRAADGSTGPVDAGLFEAWADVRDAEMDALGCRIGIFTASRQSGLSYESLEVGAPTSAGSGGGA